MGVTIHYAIKCPKNLANKSVYRVLLQVGEHLADYFNMHGRVFPGPRDWPYHEIDVAVPWRRKSSVFLRVPPTAITGFIFSYAGCEDFRLTMCKYPGYTEMLYNPALDDRVRDDDGTLNWGKWSRWIKTRSYTYVSPYAVPEQWCHQRRIRTGLGTGWYCEDFCKTEYAANPEHGGMANFVQCHTGIIVALDMLRSRGWDVRVYDETGYGTYFTDNGVLNRGHMDVSRLIGYMGGAPFEVPTGRTKTVLRRHALLAPTELGG